MIGSHLPPDSKDLPVVKEIVSRIDDLNDLMKDLLLFARPPQPKLAMVDLAKLVETTAEMLRDDPALAQVQVRIDGSLPPTMADAGLLTIVVTNLLVNGAQAMQGRGIIRVSLASSRDTCQIAFADQGPGIPAGVAEKSSCRSSPPRRGDLAWAW